MASDSEMTYWRRAGYAALSGGAGWCAGQLACLPLNLIVAARDSEGQSRLFVQTLGGGLIAWAGWTLLLAAGAWFLVVLPLVMTVRPCLLVRLRHPVEALSVLLALGLAASRLAIFRESHRVPLHQRFAVILPYAIFAVAFALVTAWMYTLLAKRRLDQPEPAGLSAAAVD